MLLFTTACAFLSRLALQLADFGEVACGANRSLLIGTTEVIASSRLILSQAVPAKGKNVADIQSGLVHRTFAPGNASDEATIESASSFSVPAGFERRSVFTVYHDLLQSTDHPGM